jgi:hypothetical protein
MRTIIATLVLLAAACSPPAEAPQTRAPSESSDAPGPAAAVNPDAAALGPAADFGQWFSDSAPARTSACYGAPESECVVSLGCEGRRVTLMSSHELAPDQDTTLTIATASQTLALPARSFNEGLASVSAELDGADPRLAALAARQDRFGVDVGGETHVYPWHESVARVLAACAG